jgi:hypothetical protein
VNPLLRTRWTVFRKLHRSEQALVPTRSRYQPLCQSRSLMCIAGGGALERAVLVA